MTSVAFFIPNDGGAINSLEGATGMIPEATGAVPGATGSNTISNCCDTRSNW